MLHETDIIPNKKICINLQDFSWGVVVQKEFYDFSDSKALIHIFPILESKYSEINLKVERVYSELGEDCSSFPYDLLIVKALHYPTSYWPSLAIDWIEERKEVTEQIMQRLKEIFEGKSYDQKLRHKAKKVYKNYLV